MSSPEDTDARPRGAATGTALLIVGVGLVVTIGAFRIPVGAGYQAVDPNLFPALVGIGTIAVGLVNLAQALRARAAAAPGAEEETAEHAGESAAPTDWRGVVLLGGAVLGYAVLLVPLGFWQTSTVFLAVAARVLGSRRPLRDLVVGLVFALAIYFLFDRLLGVGLPPGIIRWAF